MAGVRTVGMASLVTQLHVQRLGTTAPRGLAPGGRLSLARQVSGVRNDPAGMAVFEHLRTGLAALRQGSRNALDGVSMLQQSDAALERMSAVLSDMKAMVQRSASGLYSESQVQVMGVEFQAMVGQVSKVVDSAGFNGVNLLNSGADSVVVSLGEGIAQSIDTIRIRTDDMTVEGLGLTGDGEGIDPTVGTLTATSDHGVDNPANGYLTASDSSAADLRLTFHGSEGDKVVTVTVAAKKKVKLSEAISQINAQSQALVPGWDAAEAVEVGGQWVLKVSSYEAGPYAAPTVSADAGLEWERNPAQVQPSDFVGQAGTAGVPPNQFELTAPDAGAKIDAALEAVAAARVRFGSSMARLGAAHTEIASAIEQRSLAGSRIADLDAARGVGGAMTRQLFGRGGMISLLRGDVMSRAAMHLLGIPSAGDPGSTFSMQV